MRFATQAQKRWRREARAWNNTTFFGNNRAAVQRRPRGMPIRRGAVVAFAANVSDHAERQLPCAVASSDATPRQRL
jgi:hypothetical protein